MMKYADPSSVIMIQDKSNLAEVCSLGVNSLTRNGYAVFRIGRLRLEHNQSRDIAENIMRGICAEMISGGAPDGLYVEVDKPQTTIMPTDAPTRNMLMHHDGQHSSFLTPSKVLVSDWGDNERAFSSEGFTTTNTHKLYQGIFISDPGQGLSVTPFYNLVRIISDAAARNGHFDRESIARWYADNLRAAVAERAVHRSNYPTLAGMLGVGTLGLRGTPLIRAEAPISEEQLILFPELKELALGCPCGNCSGQTQRLFCHVLKLGLDISVAEFKEIYETWLVSEQFDLLISNNIGGMHGGIEGGKSRVLHPFYLTVPRPGGDLYENWLNETWVNFSNVP